LVIAEVKLHGGRARDFLLFDSNIFGIKKLDYRTTTARPESKQVCNILDLINAAVLSKKPRAISTLKDSIYRVVLIPANIRLDKVKLIRAGEVPQKLTDRAKWLATIF
jgi:hypothetical protein